MTADKIRYVVMHTVLAMTFIFVLNYFVLNTGMQTSLMWATGFGAIAFAMAWRQANGR